MAEKDIDNYLVGPARNPEDELLGTAGDFGKTLAAGTTRLGSNIAGAGRYLAEGAEREDFAALAKSIQDIFAAGTESIEGTINPKTRELAASAMTSEEFWQHPVLATSLKATGMLPSVAAIAIPGGLMADVVGATLVAGGAGAALNASEGIDEFYQKLDAMSDGDLQKQSPKYRAMRELMDEAPARAKFNREAQGWGPTINLLIGAAGGALGPAGTAARGLAGGAKNAVIGAGERGVLGSTAVGIAEGAATNAAEEGVQEYTQQAAEIDADLRREMDRARIANAALEGGAMGGLFGGAVSLVAGGARAPKRPNTVDAVTDVLNSADDVNPVATTEPAGPQVKEGSASAIPAKPVETAQVGNIQNAPTRGERDKGKEDLKTAAPADPATPAAVPIDPAIRAAVESTTPAPPATATELEALPQRSPNETLDKLDQEGQPPATVPPEVTPAPEAVTPDTGMNVPEEPASLEQQMAQIGQGDRKAVMIPKGSPKPEKIAKNLRRYNNARGQFIYDPKLVTPKEIQALSKDGRENELLGLGPVSKPQAMADAAAGATPVAITERTPTGTEVKAAAGTTATLPEQRASLEAQKSPGNVVAVETPEAVVERRNAQGGRIINTNTENIVNPKFEENEARAAAADEVMRKRIEAAEAADTGAPSGPGKNYRGKAGKDRDATIALANDVVSRNPPDPEGKEKGAHALPKPRAAVLARARAMVEEFEALHGKRIQSQIKPSKDGKSTSDSDAVLTLRLAKDLIKHEKSAQINKLITDFQADEFMIKAGHKEEVIARRREEGDRAKQQTGGDAIETKADESETKGLDEEDFPLATDEKTDDEAPSLATGAVSSVDADAAVTSEGDLSTYEASENEIKPEKSVAHIEIKLEKAKAPVMSEREKRKMRLAPAKIKNDKVDQVIADAEKAVKQPLRVSLKPRTTEEQWTRMTQAMREEEAREDATEPLTAQARLRQQIKAAVGDAPMNLNPSEAQIRAGNYKKGHRRVEGLDFTIENPKGSIRRGRGWETRMPADYGYIRRTTGADGDHVDAYDGRSGDRYFIIDQLDSDTGAFDEHKVMLRFKDEAHAIETYKNAFSDGKGAKRLGFIYEVTPAELKAWLNEGNTTEAHAKHIVRDMDAVNFDVPEGPKPGEITAGNGVVVRPTRSSNAATELDSLKLSPQNVVGGALTKFFQSRLRRLAGEIDVHYISPAEMDKLWRGSSSYNEKVSPGGLHIVNRVTGHSEVYVLDNITDDGDWFASRSHIILHEVTHAVTQREIKNVPNARNTIENIMREAARWGDDNATELSLEYGGRLNYAFTNADEFVAETFSNQDFQHFLSRVPLSSDMADYLGLNQRGSMSAWDMVRAVVRKAIQKLTGYAPDNSALDAMMRVSEHLTKIHEVDHPSPYAMGRVGDSAKVVETAAFDMTTKLAEGVRRLQASREANTATNAPKNLKLRTFNNLAEIADQFFGRESNPIRKIHNAIERMRVSAERIEQESEPLVRKLTQLRAENREMFRDFSALLHDATVANVHPDVPLADAKNAHLGKNRLDSVWAKARHKELAESFRHLDPKFKVVWAETIKHFADRQNALSLGIINNQILKLLGIKDSDLATRIHEGTLTDADKQLLGDNLEVIEKASELSKIQGPYVPLMRRGDHVVRATYKVTLPGNAKAVKDGAGNTIPNEFEFTTRKEAEDYAKASPLKADIEKVWLDPKTGERLPATELDSVDRYRVTVQTQHVEFVEGKRAADARAAELAKDGSLTVHPVVPRRFEPDGRTATDLSAALSSLLKKLEHSQAYQAATPTQRAALRQALNEAALASHGSTRISSRAILRRGVQGYSEDIVQNTSDYATSSSRYLAKLEHGPALEAGMKEMEEGLNIDHSKQGHYARELIANEVKERVIGENGFQQGGWGAPVIKRLLSISFIDKLASPAYSIINAMQTVMVTTPYLVGKYGVGRTFSAMSKAYADINAYKIAAEGAKGTARALKGGHEPKSLMDLVMHGLSKDERAMMQYQLDHGTIDATAGFEVGKLAKNYEGLSGKTDAVLGYLEGISREMPRAIETINRTVTALASYRLARDAGKTHDQAVVEAQDAVNNTQFNYSPTNSPQVFNHPLLKIALQFKKYGQGMYQLIGTQIGIAIRNMEPGDRKRAVKTLLGIAATHFAMAGALGLPTEPFKYLVMASSPFTGLTWSDVENEVRKRASSALGTTGGEVFSRGLPRFLGFDLSRMGLDSVTSFGEPRGQKEADVKSWLFDSVSGPVVSLGGDYIKGLNHLANGEAVKAAEKMVPIKVFSDSIRAYRQASEGKKRSGTGRESSAPYSPTEAAMRVLGFGNRREAEEGAADSAYYRGSSKAKAERNELVSNWVQAPPERKMKAWAAVQKYNMGAPADSKITMKELTDKARREAKASKTAVRGINPNKRDKRFLDEGFIYNTR